MIIQIDKLSQVPIYIQLTNQLKHLIILGDLKDHESLPSVRSLAGDLGVNMHTVNKAYNILVEENILTKSQQGYVVNPDRSITKDRLNDLEKRIENLLLDIFIHNVPDQEIKEIFNQKVKNLKKEEKHMWIFSLLIMSLIIIVGVILGLTTKFSRQSTPFGISVANKQKAIEEFKQQYFKANTGMGILLALPMIIFSFIKPYEKAEKFAAMYSFIAIVVQITVSFGLYF